MRSTQSVWSPIVIILVLACGGGSEPGPPALEITSRSPAPDGSSVEAGAVVSVVFDQAIDAATLTAQTFRVRQTGAADLPAALRFDGATRTATAVVPLLPGETYVVELTTGIRTPAGASLGAPVTWSFATRSWDAVVVDSDDEVGLFTSIAVDGTMRRHISHDDWTNRDLKYSTCVGACSAAANWSTVTVDADGEVGRYTSLAVDGTGRVHVSYYADLVANLKYATCSANCASAANWQTMTVDAEGSVGRFSSIAVDGTGRIHVTYMDDTDDVARYATCAAGCGSANDWDTGTSLAASTWGAFSSLTVDPTGRLHAILGVNDLTYVTCAASCASATNWESVSVEVAGTSNGVTSLAVGADGRVHVAYFDGVSDDLLYATCATSCIAAGNWQSGAIHSSGSVENWTSLAVDQHGRVHVSYWDVTNLTVRYATCAASCETTGNWRSLAVDTGGDFGEYNSLSLDGSGRVHISHHDRVNRDLRYVH